MSTNGGSSSNMPILKGEKYHLWSLKMKTLFKSQELWDLVEHGYTEPTPAPSVPDQALRENRKKDAKALFLIQSGLDDEIFPRISSANTAKEAWEIIKQEYLGDQKVIKVQTFYHCDSCPKMPSNNSGFIHVQMPDNVKVKTAFVSSDHDLALHLPEFISGPLKWNDTYYTSDRISKRGLFVGFDTEWMSYSDSESPCRTHIALLKLCNINGFCLLIELHRFETMPVALVELLAIKDITYVGVNISIQLDKLKEVYGLEMRTTIELSSFAGRKYAHCALNCKYSRDIPVESLNVLWRYIFGSKPLNVDKELLLWLLKNPWIDFGANSNDKQLQYVVFSAYATIKIAERLFDK